MLINLSNHPSYSWPITQTDIAIKTFIQISDLPFPRIPPEMSVMDLDLLVDVYVNKIRQIDPLAVHVMGELTFAFRIVNCLKKIGYRCIASTTERIVTTDGTGNKTSTFKFGQFRDY